MALIRKERGYEFRRRLERAHISDRRDLKLSGNESVARKGQDALYCLLGIHKTRF